MSTPVVQCWACLAVCSDWKEETTQAAWISCKERLLVSQAYCPRCIVLVQEKARRGPTTPSSTREPQNIRKSGEPQQVKRSREWWYAHPEDARAHFDEHVFVPFVEGLPLSKWWKKLIIKHKQMPIVDGVVQGWVAFELYTTHGFPLEMAEEAMSRLLGLPVDVEGFERCMEEFREISRGNKPLGLQSVK